MIIPTNCPSCNSKLIESSTGIDLICTNSMNCPAQIIGRLSYYCGRNIGNITGVSEKQITKFNELYNTKDICDLYNLDYSSISGLEGFGAKSAMNIENSINKSKSIPDYKFLAGLGLEGIGPEVAKLICSIL